MIEKSNEEFRKFQEFLKWEENQEKEVLSQNNPIDDDNVLCHKTRLNKIKKILLRIIIVIFLLVFILLLAWFIYSFKPDEVEKIFTPQTEQKQVPPTPKKQVSAKPRKPRIDYTRLGVEAGKKDGINDGLKGTTSNYRYSSKNNNEYKSSYRRSYDWYYKKAKEFKLQRSIEGLPIDKESFNDYVEEFVFDIKQSNRVYRFKELPPDSYFQ